MLEVEGWPGNLAGQHLDVRLTAEDGYTATRSYSIASAGPENLVELAVDRLPTGEVSPYLVDDLQVGDELEVRGPLGGWFVWKREQTEPVQLIAGGSGVVPLVAMVRAHAASGSVAPMRLLYSVRSPADVFFSQQLTELSPSFELSPVYTRQAPLGWPDPPGRVTRELLKRTTISPADSPSVYVCGPTGFVEFVADLLINLGHDPARVKTERFGGA